METLGIVLGLGNPGVKYSRTRHNLGFRVVERLAERAGTVLAVDPRLGFEARTAEAVIEGTCYILAQPWTFMNRSGRSGAELCRYHDVPTQRLLVVHDDADLALGRIRVRQGGGPGGHNGVRSLIEELGTPDFPRIRLGVRGEHRDRVDLAEYVLEAFGPEEEPIAEALVGLGAEAATSVWVQGVAKTMDRFNGTSAIVPSEDPEREWT